MTHLVSARHSHRLRSRSPVRPLEAVAAGQPNNSQLTLWNTYYPLQTSRNQKSLVIPFSEPVATPILANAILIYDCNNVLQKVAGWITKAMSANLPRKTRKSQPKCELKTMKIQIHNPSHTGGMLRPCRLISCPTFLRTFTALALLGLVVEPWSKAGPIGYRQNLDDFARTAEFIDNTNNINYLNHTGSMPLGLMGFFNSGFFPGIKMPSAQANSTQGTLFGTASLGGSWGYGTVFSLNTDGTGFTVLHNFASFDGSYPTAGLILSSNRLYGTTVNGGNVDNGTVFAMDITGTNFTVLHHFTARYYAPYTNSDGGNPYAALIQSGNTLYGTASDGGFANGGTVFAIDIGGTNFSVLHHFTKANYDADYNLTNSDGTSPRARLLLSGDTLYGTASAGGSGGSGTLFAVNTNGQNFRVLHAFAPADSLTFGNSDGISPDAGLILSGGTLYGTAFQGGSANAGTVFAVNTNGTGFTNLYNFTYGSDGAKPAGELVLYSNLLIGTASAGGDTSLNNGGNGTVFALNTNGTDFTVIYRFTAGKYDYSLINGGAVTNSDGANPQAGLVLAGDTLYGTASLGGTGGNGTVFSILLGTTPQMTIVSVTLSKTNLVISGTGGQTGETNVTLMSPSLTLPLNQWMPVATNILSTTGDFTFTATNAVDPKAPYRFYMLRGR